MNAHLDNARRGPQPRTASCHPGHGRAPAERVIPRLGTGWLRASREGLARGRTPSPVPPRPSAAPAASASDAAPRSGRRIDPRWYQIFMLSALLGYGVFGLGFGLGPIRVAATIGAALVTQYLGTRLWRLPRFDPLSALISGIGLCTLLRTNTIAAMAFAATLAIASKFLLRFRGKHLYNPTNLALVVMLIAGAGWISPGQYGHVAFVALAIVCLGLTVVCKAGRSDVTLAFLGVYAAILFGRSLWL